MAQERKNILISSLGYAPGVVTGTVDALKFFDNVEIHEVLTISTSDPLIINNTAEQILRPEFEDNKELYPWGVEYKRKEIDATDIIIPDDNKAFLKLLVDQIQDNLQQSQIDGIYISLAGGRKTMSSLVMMALKLFVDCYGSWEEVRKFRDITHLLVDDMDVERCGIIQELEKIRGTNEELFLKCIHPIKAFGEEEAKAKVHLIRMSKIFKETDKLRIEYQEWINNSHRGNQPDPMKSRIDNMF